MKECILQTAAATRYIPITSDRLQYISGWKTLEERNYPIKLRKFSNLSSKHSRTLLSEASSFLYSFYSSFLIKGCNSKHRNRVHWEQRSVSACTNWRMKSLCQPVSLWARDNHYLQWHGSDACEIHVSDHAVCDDAAGESKDDLTFPMFRRIKEDFCKEQR